MGKKVKKTGQFLVKKKGVGLCIVNENNCTITYPSGECKKLQQFELDNLKSLNAFQDRRGIFL